VSVVYSHASAVNMSKNNGFSTISRFDQRRTSNKDTGLAVQVVGYAGFNMLYVREMQPYSPPVGGGKPDDVSFIHVNALQQWAMVSEPETLLTQEELDAGIATDEFSDEPANENS